MLRFNVGSESLFLSRPMATKNARILRACAKVDAAAKSTHTWRKECAPDGRSGDRSAGK
jgi:hypothetical protein